MPSVAEIFETIMIISFGISWPLSIVRSVRSNLPRVKFALYVFIAFGYVCGIIAKCRPRPTTWRSGSISPTSSWSAPISACTRNRAIERREEKH